MPAHRPPVTRSTARKLTLVGQALAALLALGTVAIFALGLPEAAPVAEPDEPGPGAAPIDVPEPDAARDLFPDNAAVDFGAITDRISLVENAPRTDTPQTPVTPEGPGGEGPGESSPAGSLTLSDRVKFLGVVTLGSRRAAMLRVDEQQRITSEGGAVRGSDGSGRSFVHVVRVEDDRVLVRADDREVWIDRGEAEGKPAVTLVGPDAAPIAARPAATAGRPAVPGDVPDQAKEALQRRLEAIDKLVEQGRIDEDRAQVLRDRALDQLPGAVRRDRGGND